MRALIDDILAVKIIQKNTLVSSTMVNGPPRPPYFPCSCPDTNMLYNTRVRAGDIWGEPERAPH